MREGSIRIIAGEWRSRRLPVADVPGLRPSGDRARETLFNWLQPYIPGSVCLDLFAGTGALGFEAASRGAASVTLVDKHALVIDHLQKSIDALEATQLSVHHGDALQFLQNQPRDQFDIIFVDPPFQQRIDEAVLQKIEEARCLGIRGFVYLESPVSRRAPTPPAGWNCWREKTLGDVCMQLFRRC